MLRLSASEFLDSPAIEHHVACEFIRVGGRSVQVGV